MQENPISSNELFTLLEKSGLVNSDEIATLQVQSNDGPQDAREVAAELVQRGRLTSYQAEHLLAGRSGGFFLGKYKILEPLGKGGMGAVFRAEDTVLRREVALKLLPHEGSKNPRTVARFQREARLAARMQHEHIVSVYDVGVERRKHFIAMELVAGVDLARLLQDKGRLSPPEAVRIISQVATGLDYAYRQGIIHRDIKPANILITPNRKAKILDLGIARFAETGSAAAASLMLTRTGEVMGTIDYMAPEQAEETRKADTCSDLYALGCTLYECLTGRVPFPAGTTADKLRMHREELASAVNELVPEVPAALSDVVARMMAKRPEDRCQSPAEVVEALQNLAMNDKRVSRSDKIDTSELGQDDVAHVSAGPESPDQAGPHVGLEQTVERPDHDTVEFGTVDSVEYGTILGDFRIEKRIGAGGMGVVYRAHQVSLNRPVALKVIRPGIGLSATTVSRFRREAQAAAKLHHTHIVAVHAEGESDGTYYYAMELIEGVNLEQVIIDRNADKLLRDTHARERETIADRLPSDAATPTVSRSTTGLSSSGSGRGYFETVAKSIAEVADALDYAHGQGIIHRDIKPSNFMLDGHGRLRLTDFGLARILEEPGVTVSGEFLGTPRYMSPEQVVAGRMEIDHRTDIYSLGVTLYELLTGRPPFSGKHRVEVVTQIMTKEPAALRRIEKSVPIDLETICLKCLEKAPGKRFSSARELAEELRRFARNVPIHARRISAVNRIGKWCRRNLAVASLVAAVALTLLGGTIVSSVLAWKASRAAVAASASKHEAIRQADLAKENELEAKRLAAVALESENLAAASEAEARTAALRAEKQAARAEAALYALQLQSARREWETNNVRGATKFLQASRPDLRGWEYGYVQQLLSRSGIGLKGGGSDVNGVAFSPDGDTIASAGNSIRIWNTQGELITALKSSAVSVAFYPNGNLLVTGNKSGRVTVWNLDSRSKVRTIVGHKSWVDAVAVSPDGRLVASASRDKTIKLWDLEGELMRNIEGNKPFSRSVAFSPDGNRLIGIGTDDYLRVWDVASGEEVDSTSVPGIEAVAIHPKGTSYVTLNHRNTIQVWDATSLENKLSFSAPTRNPGGPWRPATLVYSPDGNWIASAGGPYLQPAALNIWNADTGALEFQLKGHSSEITSIAFSSDGTRLAAACIENPRYREGGEVRVWHDFGNSLNPMILKGHTFNVINSAKFSPDGARIASGGGDNTVRIWNATTGKEALVLQGHSQEVNSLAFSPDGKTVASGSDGDSIGLWNSLDGSMSAVLKAQADCVKFTPDGTHLVSGNGNDSIRFWDVNSRKVAKRLPPLPILCLSLTADGSRLLAGYINGAVAIVNPSDGEVIHVLKQVSRDEVKPMDVAFSPDGMQAVIAEGKQLIVFDTTSGDEIMTLEGHLGTILSVTYSPDGKRIVSGGHDDMMRIWDAEYGFEIIAIRAHDQYVSSVDFSPDGTKIVSAGWDSTVRVWNSR